MLDIANRMDDLNDLSRGLVVGVIIMEVRLNGVLWLCRDTPIAGYEACPAQLAAHPAVTAFIVMNGRAMV